jgi:hypothetical protein
MVVVAYQPEALRIASEGVEVLLVLGLLIAALVLVTVLSLLHTAPRSHHEDFRQSRDRPGAATTP